MLSDVPGKQGIQKVTCRVWKQIKNRKADVRSAKFTCVRILSHHALPSFTCTLIINHSGIDHGSFDDQFSSYLKQKSYKVAITPQ